MDMSVDVSSYELSIPAIYEQIKNPKDWSGENAMMEKLNIILIGADWMLTKKIIEANNRDDIGSHELNPFLGKHPSQEKINMMIGTALISQVIIARLLPSKYRKWFQFMVYSGETYAVGFGVSSTYTINH